VGGWLLPSMGASFRSGLTAAVSGLRVANAARREWAEAHASEAEREQQFQAETRKAALEPFREPAEARADKRVLIKPGGATTSQESRSTGHRPHLA